jgi:hypothetical protein
VAVDADSAVEVVPADAGAANVTMIVACVVAVVATIVDEM